LQQHGVKVHYVNFSDFSKSVYKDARAVNPMNYDVKLTPLAPVIEQPTFLLTEAEIREKKFK
jgi:hypothetical protein